MLKSEEATACNPYAAPDVEVIDEAPALQRDDRSLLHIARETFLAWEKLRLIYIVVLGVVTLLAAAMEPRALLASIGFWVLVVEGAVVANVCYFVGPVIETYVKWLGFRVPWLRAMMFVLGTTFAMALAFGAVIHKLVDTIFD